MLQKNTYKPQIKDLLRLYEFIILNKEQQSWNLELAGLP